MERLVKAIDAINERQGQISALLILPLTGVVIYEVIMRYIFNAPTIWGFEATTFLYGIHYMLGLSYTELVGGHVKVDVLVNHLPPRARAAMGLFTGIVIFMPVFTALAIWCIKFAWISCAQLEHNSTSWAPPIYPIKVLMALGVVLLWMQGLATTLKFAIDLRRGGRQ